MFHWKAGCTAESDSTDHSPSILHIGKYYPPHMGGIEIYLRNLVAIQSSQAHVEVIVSGDSIRTQEEFADGARITRLGTPGVVASMPICPTLHWTIRQRKADLVHLHLPNPAAALAFLTSGHRGKLVITHHSDTLGRRSLKWLSDPFVRRVMERASAVIVTSKRYLDSSEELAPVRRKCHVVPLGIDLAPFEREYGSATKEIEQRYGKRLILAVGRLVPYKGFEYLIRSMRDIDARLLLIGTGPLMGKLQSLIQQCGVAERVCILGKVKDIAPYYKAAELFVLPSISRAEAFGIVQLEAMASGIPVVNTDIDSGVPEVSVHDETGLTVLPRNPKALAQSINLLLNNPEMRRKFGLAAAARVKLEFSALDMAERTLRLYESILNPNTPKK